MVMRSQSVVDQRVSEPEWDECRPSGWFREVDKRLDSRDVIAWLLFLEQVVGLVLRY